MASRKIGYVCSGLDTRLIGFDDYSVHIDDMLCSRELDQPALDDRGAIVLPDFSDEGLPRRHARHLDAYLAGGGFPVVFEPAHRRLAVMDEARRPAGGLPAGCRAVRPSPRRHRLR